METKKRWLENVNGYVLSALYCATYLTLWCLSFDQWFLPAALRLSCLLFLPVRRWPYVFAGDAAAFLVLRVPKAEVYGDLWAYLSPFLSLPFAASVIYPIKRYLKAASDYSHWMTAIAALFAISATTSNLLLNHGLSGPVAEHWMETGIRFAIGQYIGILTVLPLLLVWRFSELQVLLTKTYRLNVAIAAVMIAALYACTAQEGGVSASTKQVALVLMILPAAILMFLHGWRGAAIGVAMVNFAVSMTLKHTGIAGAHDEDVFVAQVMLAMATTLVLISGAQISKLFERADLAGLSEDHAWKTAHASYPTTEEVLREQYLYSLQLQHISDEDDRRFSDYLREQGHARAAMEVNTRILQRQRVFRARGQALYPIRIETDGLFAVLYSEEFSEFFATGAQVGHSFSGNVRDLTLDLQLAAFRCVCHAMNLQAECLPETFKLYLRAWKSTRRRGLYVRIVSIPRTPLNCTAVGENESMYLRSRINSWNGHLKCNKHRISFLLSESADAVSRVATPLPEL